MSVGKFPNTLKKQLLYVRNQLAEKKNILKFDELENKLQLGVVEKKNNILVGMVAVMILIILIEHVMLLL